MQKQQQQRKIIIKRSSILNIVIMLIYCLLNVLMQRVELFSRESCVGLIKNLESGNVKKIDILIIILVCVVS
jgi:hypothetical protein